MVSRIAKHGASVVSFGERLEETVYIEHMNIPISHSIERIHCHPIVHQSDHFLSTSLG